MAFSTSDRFRQPHYRIPGSLLGFSVPFHCRTVRSLGPIMGFTAAVFLCSSCPLFESDLFGLLGLLFRSQVMTPRPNVRVCAQLTAQLRGRCCDSVDAFVILTCHSCRGSCHVRLHHDFGHYWHATLLFKFITFCVKVYYIYGGSVYYI